MSNPFFGKTLATLQLVRYPNLFTAAADIFAGYFMVHGARVVGSDRFLLGLSSMCLYAAGCVLNDLADQEVDAVERPFRPIPSGRVSIRAAWTLLVILLSAGLCPDRQHSRQARLRPL